MEQAVIVSALRTPVGSFGKSLSSISAVQLGVTVAKQILDQTGLDPAQIDEVILGNVLQAGQGQNPARQVAINAGLAQETPAFTVNKVCASGLKSVALAAQSIMLGDADIVLAGGIENMSRTPYALPGARWGQRMGDGQMLDLMILDGLWEIFNGYHMGITAENIAEKYALGREEQDKFGLQSQHKAGQAIQSGRFQDEIVPVSIPQRKKEPIVFSIDEHPKADSTMQALGKIRPAFKKDGTVTAGNASGINDAASLMLVMSQKKAQQLGLKPMAAISAYASAGVDPAYMGLGPIPATRNALQKAGKGIQDLDLLELNEAFAAQSLACLQELEPDPERVNVNGGAIALGHPIGASGARILTTLLHEMQKRDSRLGLATLCVGGGQGHAMIVER